MTNLIISVIPVKSAIECNIYFVLEQSFKQKSPESHSDH